MDIRSTSEKVRELSVVEGWNHRYEFPDGVATKSLNMSDIGSNVLKWTRLVPILNRIGIDNKSVLDAGCSDGYFSIQSSLMGARAVVGLDPDNLRIEKAKFAKEILNVKNVEFICDDLYNWGENAEKFDVVLALGILHRVPDMHRFLEKLTKLGNTIVLEFKALGSTGSDCIFAGETKNNFFNKLFFIPSVGMVSDILNSFGFQVVEVNDDKSNLKYKRVILVASKKKSSRNHIFENYKDIHKGKRVFLIGNGPSLAKTDLSLLENEYTIAMNRISLIYPKFESWRPSYYLFSSTNVTDSSWGSEWLSSVHAAISEASTTSFIATVFKSIIDVEDKFSNVHWFDSLTETRPGPKGEISEESFSTDIVERIDKSGTSMSIALQLAYHMGFSEIVLVGADLGWKKDLGSRSDPNHFDENYRANISDPYKANFQMRNVHRKACAKFLSNKPNVKIYNGSVRTVLDTYPLIKFEEFVKTGEIIERYSEWQEAMLFWDKQFFQTKKKRALYRRILTKLKKTILKLLYSK